MNTRTPTWRALPAIGLAALLGAALAGCTSAPSASLDTATERAVATQVPTAPPTPTPTGSAPPSPTPTPIAELVSPLSGLPVEALRPVLVVKLDNTQYAQPHAGLEKADLVYLEEVEYGITRLAAVFSSRIPTRIGPVRSARITDIDLLAQYDRPAFGFSGAQRRMLPVLAAAPFYDISPNKGAAGYTRDYGRRAPYNYYLDGRVGIARAPRATLAHDIGFAFSSDLPPGGLTAKTATMEWGYSSAAFRYDPAAGRYAVTLNGQRARSEANDKGQNAATVVIQYVRQRPSAYFDKGGGNTPHAETIGTGRALVLRDGQVWTTTWSRPTADSGTVYTLADGTVMPFKAGQTWIVLLDRTRKATVRPMTEPPATATMPVVTGSATPTPTPTP
jgi:hypothetical protein